MTIPERFSGSMLSSYASCPRLFKYQFLDKLQEPGPLGMDRVYGTGVHSAIQACLESQADPVSVFEEFWGMYQDADIQRGGYDYEELLRQARIMLGKFARNHAKRFKIFKMEERLKSDVLGLEGTPDFLGDFDGVPSVVDFKTTSYRYPPEKAAIAEQLWIYVALALESGFTAKQVVFFPLVKGREPSIQTPVVYPVTQQMLEEHLSNVQMQKARIQGAQAFTKNPGNCYRGKLRCGYFNLCHGRLVVTPK